MKFVKTFEKFTGGQVAYHGSPYSFSSFEFGKTGVNTKNWGWGLYFTSNRDVARYYADISLAEDFYGSGLSIKVDGIELKDKVKKWAEVYQKARNILRTWGKDKVNDFCRLMRKEFPDLKDYFKPKHITLKYDAKKWLYDVTATSGLKIEDWDSKPSRELLAKLDSQFHSNRYSTTYKSISNKLGGDEEASKYLLDLGIDGHVYKGYKGEDNWVIYDVSKLAVANKEEVGEINESMEESNYDKINKIFPITVNDFSFLFHDFMSKFGDNIGYVWLSRSYRRLVNYKDIKKDEHTEYHSFCKYELEEELFQPSKLYTDSAMIDLINTKYRSIIQYEDQILVKIITDRQYYNPFTQRIEIGKEIILNYLNSIANKIKVLDGVKAVKVNDDVIKNQAGCIVVAINIVYEKDKVLNESIDDEENTKPTLTDEQIDKISEFYNYCESCINLYNQIQFSGIYAEIYNLLDENGIADQPDNNDSRPVNPTTFKTWVRNMSMMWKYEKRAQKNIEEFNEKMITIYHEVKDFKKHDPSVFDEIESCVFDLLSDNDNINVRKTVGYSLQNAQSWKVIPLYSFEIYKNFDVNTENPKRSIIYRGKEYTNLHNLYADVLSKDNSILYQKLDSHFQNVEMNHRVDEDYGDTIVTITVIE